MASDPESVAGERERLGRSGFESGSDIYERSRPDYSDEAVARLVATTGMGPGSRVLDLAAGTGKLTRRLHALGSTCVAVEPSPSMREVFRRAVPGVPVIGATAESIPLLAGAVDVVVVAQAFHWFDPDRALPEIARVLRPRGWLALIWNERDESDPVMAELVRISKWDQCQPYPVGMDFSTVIDDCRLFGPVQRSKSTFVQSLDRAAFVEQVASRSYVQVLGDAEQAALLDKVAALGATLTEPIAMPYIADLFCARLAV